MKAGALKSRVTIQQQTATQDAVGQPVNTWTTFATVWADVRHQSGMETVRQEVQISTVKASIRIRYRTGVTPAMRVLHGSAVYQIMAVLPDANNKDFLDLICERYSS